MKKRDQPAGLPPKWAMAFLEWFCPPDLIEGILGDLLEQFEFEQQQRGLTVARRAFIWNVIRLFHPAIILRNHLSVHLINISMLKSHLLVAFRSMKKYKFYSAINILGLSFAFAFVFLSFLFIGNELSYDQFHREKDHIYRIYATPVNVETGKPGRASAVTAVPVAKDMAEELPAVREFTRIASGSTTIRIGNTPYTEVVSYADPGFLKMFDFPLIYGDMNSALSEPGSIILSAEKAEKYFGKGDPRGQTLAIDMVDSVYLVTVTGVMEARKERSSIQIDLLTPMEQYKILVGERFFNSYHYGVVENYIMVDPGVREADLGPLLTKAVQKYSPPEEHRTELGVQSLAGLHLEHEIRGNTQYTHPRKLYIMLALALLVLVIAAINFITLSTSHALNRMKEIGVRKTLGALRGQLRRQMVVESFFVTFISGALGLGLANLLLPGFAELIGNPMYFSIGIREAFFLLLIILSIAWITGLLQSALLVRHSAVNALKGNLIFPRRNRWLNESLVVLQFSLSIILIIGAVIIRNQMQYINHKDLGFDEELLLEIPMGKTSNPEAGRQLVARFKNEALKNQRIKSITAAMNSSEEPWTSLVFDQDDGTKETIFYNQVEEDYLQTMGIELVAGSDFYKDTKNAAQAILVNEALVKHFDWEHPVDQFIPGKTFEQHPTVIGVVRDFHFSSLHRKIEPLIIALDKNAVASGISGLSTYVWPPNLYRIIVRVTPGDIQPVLLDLENTWKELNPDRAFAFHFVDEVLASQYAEEQRWAKVINSASLFAIVIAWLGLLGLMRLSVQKRTKEIGIRKVLGSSTAGVISLLSKRYFLLVLTGSLIAWPVAWLLASRWLESFSYRIDLHPFLFLLVGLGVLVIAIASVGWQSFRAASANPVEALGYE